MGFLRISAIEFVQTFSQRLLPGSALTRHAPNPKILVLIVLVFVKFGFGFEVITYLIFDSNIRYVITLSPKPKPKLQKQFWFCCMSIFDHVIKTAGS